MKKVIYARVDEIQKEWVTKEADRQKISESDVIKLLINKAMGIEPVGN